MKPADAYGALHDAAGTPLRLWMQSNRPAFDAAVRKAGTARAPAVRLASPEPRTLPDPIRSPYAREGTILRREDGTRVVRVQEYSEHAGWWLEFPGAEPRLAGDAEVRGMGPWAVEAWAPGWKRDTRVVYIDLDGKGRKIYLAKPIQDGALHTVTVDGKVYYLAGEGRHWPGRADDAADYRVVGEPHASRRSEAQKKRATLSPEAQALFDGVVFALVRRVGGGWPDTLARLLDEEAVPFVAWNKGDVIVGGDTFSFAGISDADVEAFKAVWTNAAKRQTMTAASLRRLAQAGKVLELEGGVSRTYRLVSG
jgi:hypothetical protein